MLSIMTDAHLQQPTLFHRFTQNVSLDAVFRYPIPMFNHQYLHFSELLMIPYTIQTDDHGQENELDEAGQKTEKGQLLINYKTFMKSILGRRKWNKFKATTTHDPVGLANHKRDKPQLHYSETLSRSREQPIALWGRVSKWTRGEWKTECQF